MPKKILAVDDEKHIVRLVEINLIKEGFEVMTATNGREALESVAAKRPDLIVMDVMMPEMDGFAALKKLKENPETADIPVIMLTAKAQDADVFKGWQSGADLYLTKPFNPSELITFVQRIFENQEETKDEAYDLSEAGVYDIGEIDESLLKPELET
jgi:two-component system alkaline phosphatase synthesis response regulator PhoP